MRTMTDFLWLAFRCIAFIWIITTVLILILFVVGTEADGLTLSESLLTAVKYGSYTGGIFGTLLAITLALKSWRITRGNNKKLARRNSSPSKGSLE